MASPSILSVSGVSDVISGIQKNVVPYDVSWMAMNLESHKKRRISWDVYTDLPVYSGEIKDLLPKLSSSEYYVQPCLKELAEREIVNPDYCRRVPDFTVGRTGYGYIKFLGYTDVRRLDLDQIVKFQRHQVTVYDDEKSKPLVGEGLNKAAEVTLVLSISKKSWGKERVDHISYKLKQSAERQGATFISFDPANGFWKFLVPHFSRFGLSDDEAEDIVMDDAQRLEDPVRMNGDKITNTVEEHQAEVFQPELSHSLPAHLGLDPVKMKEMRMLMFHSEDADENEDFRGKISQHTQSLIKRNVRPPQRFTQENGHQNTPSVVRKTPLALLEYNPGSNKSSPGSILMAHENKNVAVKKSRTGGFELDLGNVTPVTENYSHNVVDAALFMGRSFRAGWGPNGVLLHTGTAMGSSGSRRVLSSVINKERIAIDKVVTVVKVEDEKVTKEFPDSMYEASLGLHKLLHHETQVVEVGSFRLKLYKVVADRVVLPDICSRYIDIIEKQLEVTRLSTSAKLSLMHQVMVWELLNILFSERENNEHETSSSYDNMEDMMQDVKENSEEVDPESLPLIRRAQFSRWLKESVGHRVQEDVSSLNDLGYLEHLFFLLSGRQLDSAVELAISNGDVRLACLLSQAGGSTVNRNDIVRQLDLWRMNGLDGNYIEKERIRIYELLAGNILDALQDVTVDWKRFIGLLMWHSLPPDSSLPVIFQNYQLLLEKGKAPQPLPIYIDEGPLDVSLCNDNHCDLLYYLMRLHNNEEKDNGFIKNMFSASSSSDNPLEYHMIWHQREVLAAIGALTSDGLQVVDMGFVAQLLSHGLCHWAIYVVLHIPHCEDYPYLQVNTVREILFRYCETWGSDDLQRQFIKDLGVPSEWMYEALAVYDSYHGDLANALDNFLACANWQKAHCIFMTSVAHSLFLAAGHSEIWRIATSMDDRKSEIENWDLGAGIYISFYLLKSSLEEEWDPVSEPDFLDRRRESCHSFVGRLNESLAVWDNKLPIEARVAYSKMAEEISDLLLSNLEMESDRETQLSCFETVFTAPLPEDVRSVHLQDAVSLYSLYLSEMGQTTAA